MNSRERLMVSRLVTRIAEQPAVTPDAEAALEVAALLKVRPDAPYLLLERTLLLEGALEQSRLEVERLGEALRDRPRDAGAPPDPLSREAQRQPVPAAASAATMAAPISAAAAAGGGFLRNAATIGAGVLGGSLLFQGIESLWHGGASRGGGGFFGASGQQPVEVIETTNNYFGASGPAVRDAGPTADASDGGWFDVGSDDDGGGWT